jgi:two-component system alkaline phosphatase synthesis response regulator PhoP
MAKIAIIEDDQLLSQMYSKKFEKDGYEVINAEDGEEGLKLIKKHKPNLVLLDIMMPKMNGLQVLQAIKEDPDEQVKTTPVIMLTNLGRTDEDVHRGLELGAVSYLVKRKVKPVDVVIKVKEILRASGYDKLLDIPQSSESKGS